MSRMSGAGCWEVEISKGGNVGGAAGYGDESRHQKCCAGGGVEDGVNGGAQRWEGGLRGEG